MGIFFTDQALFDLEEIRDYFDRIAPFATEKILSSIIERVFQLETHPNSGPIEPFLFSFGFKRHFLIEGNYKIVYRIIGGTIYITQIFDARQNPSKMIKNEYE